MKFTFEKATLIAKGLETMLDRRNDQFRRTTNMLQGKGGIVAQTYNKANGPRAAEKLQSYQRDIAAIQSLLNEMRGEIAALAEGVNPAERAVKGPVAVPAQDE